MTIAAMTILITSATTIAAAATTIDAMTDTATTDTEMNLEASATVHQAAACQSRRRLRRARPPQTLPYLARSLTRRTPALRIGAPTSHENLGSRGSLESAPVGPRAAGLAQPE